MVTKIVSFEVSTEDAERIAKIVARAASYLNIESQLYSSRLDLSMDITACHANGCLLELESLLDADKFNFLHDVTGISRHIDRRTGKLRNFFLPRYAVKAVR